MGRNAKIGLDYFPFEVDFFNDIKVRKLIKYQGGKAVTIYALLLCFIYKSGYYTGWDEELPFIVSEQTGFDEVYISEVIKSCLKLGLFSEELFNKHKVLTSKGIQERYIYICNLSKRKVIISPELNISSEEIGIYSEEMDISSEEMPINSVKSTQRKEKERKEKEEKNKTKKETELSDSKTSNQQASNFVKPTVEQVRAYCKERNNGIDAEQFIDHYISNGWMVGKTKMKDWKAAVRTWERNRQNTTSANGQSGAKVTPAGVRLGKGEWITADGRRTYGPGKANIPMDAPARPSEQYTWNAETNKWYIS